MNLKRRSKVDLINIGNNDSASQQPPVKSKKKEEVFVLHWEIDNAAARSATGRMESEVFKEKGFAWTAALEKRATHHHDKTNFTLRCDSDHNRFWKCDAEVEVLMFNGFLGNFAHWARKERFCFSENNCLWLNKNSGPWAHFTHQSDEPLSAPPIHIITSESGDPISDLAKFLSPNTMSNVILKFGDKKLHVSKEYLAVHSPVFETLFFGNFAEKEKEEVEIKDVVYEEFVDLLNWIYPGAVKLSDRKLLHILKLADRFDMKGVMVQAENYLIETSGIKNKLLIADQFRFNKLRDHCLDSFNTSQEMFQTLKSYLDTVNYSDELKLLIFDRLMKN